MCVFFDALSRFRGQKKYVIYDLTIRNNGTKMIDKKTNKIIISLTVLGKFNREKALK